MSSAATKPPLGASLLALVVLVMLVVAACGDDDGSTSPPPASQAPTEIGVKVPAELRPGREIAAQSGCLACHRIGSDGIAGPGPNLTHAGSELSAAQIRRAIVTGPSFMPPYDLPPAKLKSLVAFIAALD